MISTISDSCFTCGDSTHFADKCPDSPKLSPKYKGKERAKYSGDENDITPESSTSDDSHFEDEKDIILPSKLSGLHLEKGVPITRTRHPSRGVVRGNFRGNLSGDRQGNWTCSECKGYNYSRRTTCYSCNHGKILVSEAQ